MKSRKKVEGPHVEQRSNKDVKDSVDRFVKTLTDLQSLLAQETDYLKKADSQNFFRLQERKIHLAHAYSDEVAQMMDMSETLKEKYPNIGPYLQQKRDELQIHIKENERALQTMQRSSKRLSDRIMDIAREAAIAQNSVAYGAGGRLGQTKKASMGLSEQA